MRQCSVHSCSCPWLDYYLMANILEKVILNLNSGRSYIITTVFSVIYLFPNKKSRPVRVLVLNCLFIIFETFQKYKLRNNGKNINDFFIIDSMVTFESNKIHFSLCLYFIQLIDKSCFKSILSCTLI